MNKLAQNKAKDQATLLNRISTLDAFTEVSTVGSVSTEKARLSLMASLTGVRSRDLSKTIIFASKSSRLLKL